MTFRAVLASCATVLALGAAAPPARANGIGDPLDDLKRAVRDEVLVGNDDCLWVHHRQVACPPWGYLPVDVRTLVPPAQ